MSRSDFAALLSFRTSLRRFERWSESQARKVGLTPAQHQLLLAVVGHDDDRGPTISDLADYLLLKHHSTVELVNRCEKAGYVARVKDASDGRVVRVQLTDDGDKRIHSLSELHLDELRRFAPVLDHLVDGLEHQA